MYEQIFCYLLKYSLALKEQFAHKPSNEEHQSSLCPSPTVVKSIHIIPKRSSNFPSEMTISSLGTISWSRLLSNK